MNETCRSCRFWINDEHMSQMCRLNPQYVAHGPQDWCGQWAESEAAARARVQEANLRFYESQKAELERREHLKPVDPNTGPLGYVDPDTIPPVVISSLEPEPDSPTAAPGGQDMAKPEIARQQPVKRQRKR